MTKVWYFIVVVFLTPTPKQPLNIVARPYLFQKQTDCEFARRAFAKYNQTVPEFKGKKVLFNDKCRQTQEFKLPKREKANGDVGNGRIS